MPPLSRLGEIIQQNTLGPCRGTTVANITLSGLQTIDSVVYTPGNRILVRSQTNTAENGIYIVGAGAWTRAPDWNGSSDIRSGTLVAVMEGLQAGIYQSSFGGALNVGTTEVGFSRLVQSIPDAQNDANLFGGQPPSYYLAYENFTGLIPTEKISGLDNLITGLETNKADQTDFLALQTQFNNFFGSPPSNLDELSEIIDGLAEKASQLDVYTQGQIDTALSAKADSATTLAGYGITNALTEFEINSNFVALSTPAGGQIIDTNSTIGFRILDSNGDIAFWVDNVAGALKLGASGVETLIRSAEEDTKVDGKIIATRDHVAANFAGLTEFTALQTAFNNFYGSPPENLNQISELITELGLKAESVDVYTQAQVDTALSAKADSATTLAGYGITNALTEFEINSNFVALNTPAGGQAIDTNTTIGLWVLGGTGEREIWVDNTAGALKLGSSGRDTLIRSAEEDTKVDGKIIATRDHVAASTYTKTEADNKYAAKEDPVISGSVTAPAVKAAGPAPLVDLIETDAPAAQRTARWRSLNGTVSLLAFDADDISKGTAVDFERNSDGTWKRVRFRTKSGSIHRLILPALC